VGWCGRRLARCWVLRDRASARLLAIGPFPWWGGLFVRTGLLVVPLAACLVPPVGWGRRGWGLAVGWGRGRP
jgi:hypothetical protein